MILRVNAMNGTIDDAEGRVVARYELIMVKKWSGLYGRYLIRRGEGVRFWVEDGDMPAIETAASVREAKRIIARWIGLECGGDADACPNADCEAEDAPEHDDHLLTQADIITSIEAGIDPLCGPVKGRDERSADDEESDGSEYRSQERPP